MHLVRTLRASVPKRKNVGDTWLCLLHTRVFLPSFKRVHGNFHDIGPGRHLLTMGTVARATTLNGWRHPQGHLFFSVLFTKDFSKQGRNSVD